MTQYGLGCLPFEEDDRDYKFKDLISCVGQYPEEYIPILHSARLNQGLTSMCTAFALATSRYMFELHDSNNNKMFSPGYIYGNRDTLDYKGEGMMIRQALKTLQKYGVCYLTSFNKIGSYVDCKTEYESKKDEYNSEAYPYRISSYWGIGSDNEIKQSIITNGFAIVSYNVYDNWYNVGTDGKIANNYGKNYGAHCVLLVGWTKNNEWIVLNSWGRSWGDNGLGYIPMSIYKNEAWCVLDNIQETFFKSLKDIDNHWAKTSINKAVQYGIIKGYEDGTFRPDEPITRAEAAIILANVHGYKGEFKSTSFKDVPLDAWYKNQVGYCENHSLFTGYEDGTFRPYNNLTRAEAAKLLCIIGKVTVKPEIKNEYFKDVPKKHWACRFINALYENHYIKGYENGFFNPDGYITRAEFITIVDRLGLIG